MKLIKISRKIKNCYYCLRKYGFKYTIQLVKTKLKKNNSVKNEKLVNLPKIEEKIKFSILVPLYNTNLDYLEVLIQSILNQTYSNWEICLADGSNENSNQISKFCNQYVQQDKRIKYKKLEKNLGISENTNQCANMATGDYFVLCDHDDVLYTTALYYNAVAISESRADVLYSDEDHLSIDGKKINPLYKPNFSKDLLYSQMYICHLLAFKKDIFVKVGGFRKEFDGSQDYDLMLRFLEKTDKICHIPQLLYSWREIETSTAINPNAKPYAHLAGLKALNKHLEKEYSGNAYAKESKYLFVYDTRFNYCTPDTMISIIIPMKDQHKLTENCVDSILNISTHQNFEILILNNKSVEQATFDWLDSIQKQDNRIKVVEANFEFNWSKLNNLGIKHASGSVYIFLNNDTVVISPDWIERLCENALRNDIGVVGPMLLYEDSTIQHAGVVVGLGGWADHVFKCANPIHYGTPFISPMVNRNVLAVTGACMAISKNTIKEIGLFDEAFIICGSDVEMCIRAHKLGKNNLFLAQVQLYHLESKSRTSYIPQNDFECSAKVYAEYRDLGDPFYNINLDYNSVYPEESGVLQYDLEKLKKIFKEQ